MSLKKNPLIYETGVLLFITVKWIETFSPKGVWKKAKEKCEKILVVASSNPRRQLRFFHILPLLFFQTPLGEKVSI